MSATTTTPQGSRPHGPGTSARRLVMAGTLAVVAVLASAMAGTWSPPTTEAAPPAPPGTEVRPGDRPPEQDPLVTQLQRMDPPDIDLSWVGIGVLVVLGSVLLAWLGRLLARRFSWLRRRTSEEDLEGGPVVRGPIVMPSIATLHAGAAHAERRLRSHARPVDAVIAAWVALESAAEESGVTREVSATPTEFTVDVLDRTPADPAATRVLLDLYLKARFGDEPVVAADVDAAERALRALTRTLAPEGPAPEAAP